MSFKIIQGDVVAMLKTMEPKSVNTCVTSPPYWGLRDYGVEGQIGLETTLEAFIAKMVEVFGEVKRVLKDDGTLWLNLGDSYASDVKGSGGPSKIQDGNVGSRFKPYKLNHGLKQKDLVGIPWRVAFALQADGWYLRSDIIWHKPNPMPESVTDRPTKSHEYIFLMAKSEKYYYDADAIKEPLATEPHAPGNKKLDNGYSSGSNISDKSSVWGSDGLRNKRSVWTVTTQPFPEAHFATFPEELIIPCILAGSPAGGVVLDPFCGSGTTGVVAIANQRNFVGIELNPKYIQIATDRINNDVGLMARMME